MMQQARRRDRIIRLTVDPTWSLACAWSPPRTKPSPSAPPGRGAVRLMLMTWIRDTDGHIVLGDTCYTFAQVDSVIRQYEPALQSLRRKAHRLYAAQAKAQTRDPA